jgi:hypothetical protein
MTSLSDTGIIRRVVDQGVDPGRWFFVWSQRGLATEHHDSMLEFGTPLGGEEVVITIAFDDMRSFGTVVDQIGLTK